MIIIFVFILIHVIIYLFYINDIVVLCLYLIMKVSIRLQNIGKINHPLWRIVVAPNRKNIKGRYL